MQSETDLIFLMRDGQGADWPTIAARLNTTTSRVARIYQRYAPGRAERTDADNASLCATYRRCMTCATWIMSEHAGHRRCEPCRHRRDAVTYDAPEITEC